MKRVIWTMLVSLSVLWAVPAYAKLVHPTIYLDEIVGHEIGERGKDEVYLSVAEFHSDGTSQAYTVPGHFVERRTHYGSTFPPSPPRHPTLYWDSDNLSEITNLKLWDKPLMEGDAVEIVISLIEHDLPPWDLDDLIGTLKLRLRNEKGQLYIQWKQIGDKDGAMKEEKFKNAPILKNYSFKDKHGDYSLKIRLDKK